MALCKMTDADGRTYGGCQWDEGVEHRAPGNGELCSDAWIHAYRDPLLAVLFNPVHGSFTSPLLWEAEGDVGIDDGTKVGCTRLRTIRQIPLPVVTTEQRIRWAILCAMTVYDEPEWRAWAKGWLDGTDRSKATAAAAVRAWTQACAAGVEAADAAGVEAAWAAGEAGAAGVEAAWAAGVEAADAAREATKGNCDVLKLAKQAIAEEQQLNPKT